MKKSLRIIGWCGIALLAVVGFGSLMPKELPRQSMSHCPGSREFTSDWKITSFDEVKLKREHYPGHWGYELSIKSNGSVTFERAKDNPINPAGQLLPEQNAEIVQAINDAAFFSIPTDKYQIDACTHAAIVSVSVTAEGKSHRVSRLCCEPPRQLMNFENVIHRIANTDDQQNSQFPSNSQFYSNK